MKLKFILTILLLLFSSALLLSSCSDSENAKTEVISAEVKNEKVTLKATLDSTYIESHSGKELYLMALPKAELEGTLGEAFILAESKVKSKMTFKFSLYEENGSSRIAHAFVLAEKNGDKYAAITDPYYISDPEAVASLDKKGSSALGIKGFSTDDVFEAKLTGADIILLDARMDKLMLADFRRDAVRSDLDGISYYYDKSEVERLDRLVSDAENAGMKIYLRTTLCKDILDEDDASEELSFLYFKKAQDSYGYLPNLGDERAVLYVKAFYAFLASRYNVSEFIIGERVNDYAEHCNAGSLSSDEFEIMYSFWARLANQMLKSVNSSASVIIPIDDCWRTDASSGKLGAKVFLTRFADRAKKGGDFDYSIALNLCEANDLSSLLSGKEADPSDIGAENLSELVKFIESPDMRYNGEKRRMIIDGLSLSSEVFSETDCASYYTAIYYIASENGFDAFICSSSPYLDSEDKGAFYYAAVMCGTSLNSQLSEYTDRISKLEIPKFTDHVTNKLTYIQSASESIDESVKKNTRSLPLKVSDLTACGGVYDIQGVLNNKESGQVSLIIRSNTKDGTAAISACDIAADDIISSGYLAITMSSPDASSASVIMTCKDRTFIGETDISSTARTYYFDISGFTKEAKSSDILTLTICFSSDREGDITSEIENISLCGSSRNGLGATVTIIIVIVSVLLVIGLMTLLIVKRKKKSMAQDRDDE